MHVLLKVIQWKCHPKAAKKKSGANRALGSKSFLCERHLFQAYKTELKVLFKYSEALWSGHEPNVLLLQSSFEKLPIFIYVILSPVFPQKYHAIIFGKY